MSEEPQSHACALALIEQLAFRAGACAARVHDARQDRRRAGGSLCRAVPTDPGGWRNRALQGPPRDALSLPPGDGYKYWATTTDEPQSRVLNRVRVEDDIERQHQGAGFEKHAIAGRRQIAMTLGDILLVARTLAASSSSLSAAGSRATATRHCSTESRAATVVTRAPGGAPRCGSPPTGRAMSNGRCRGRRRRFQSRGNPAEVRGDTPAASYRVQQPPQCVPGSDSRSGRRAAVAIVPAAR